MKNGPAQEETLIDNGFNEGKGKPFGYEDIRFAVKGDVLYATVMGWPQDGKLTIKSLANNSQHLPKEIQKVEWLPNGQALTFERTENGLGVVLSEKTSDELTYANVIRILS